MSTVCTGPCIEVSAIRTAPVWLPRSRFVRVRAWPKSGAFVSTREPESQPRDAPPAPRIATRTQPVRIIHQFDGYDVKVPESLSDVSDSGRPPAARLYPDASFAALWRCASA